MDCSEIEKQFVIRLSLFKQFVPDLVQQIANTTSIHLNDLLDDVVWMVEILSKTVHLVDSHESLFLECQLYCDFWKTVEFQNNKTLASRLFGWRFNETSIFWNNLIIFLKVQICSVSIVWNSSFDDSPLLILIERHNKNWFENKFPEFLI